MVKTISQAAETYQIGQVMKIVKNHHAHEFEIGTPVRIIELDEVGLPYRAEHLDKSDWWIICDQDVTPMDIRDFSPSAHTVDRQDVGTFAPIKYSNIMLSKKQTKDTTFEVAAQLLKANNTVTTLEVKEELRSQYPNLKWVQEDMHQFFTDWVNEGKLVVSDDNGTYRTYSFPARSYSIPSTKPTVMSKPQPVKKEKKETNRLSRKRALELMKDNKGQFFTVVFIEKNGTERKMNAQYLKDQADPGALGYVKVRDAALMKKDPKNCIRNINLQTLKSISIQGKSYKVS